MSRPDVFSPAPDVLVLGAGLAGLRAGIAALEERPGADVLCCALGRGAAGSSFANCNNALGMQVLADEDEAAFFVERALHIAAPGHAEPSLVRLLATESLQRAQEMLDWGVPFRGAEQGLETVLARRTGGCFIPEQHSAAIFDNLGRAYEAFAARFRKLGGRMLPETSVLGLLRRQDRAEAPVCGALIQPQGQRQPLLLPAHSVVMALGGPAALYGQNVAGPAVPGWSYALLQRGGATVANAGFLQFMWYLRAPRRFLSLHAMAQQHWQVRSRHTAAEGGHPLDFAANLRSFAALRGGHCPYGYAHKDAAMDHFLLDNRDEGGLVQVRAGGEEMWRDAAVMAHAGNGGARIDHQGRTDTPGLYACGECATGMHGANRMGGGMVLATQVFGARAGACAAREAAQRQQPAAADLLLGGGDGSLRPPGDGRALLLEHSHDAGAMAWLKGALAHHAVCGGDPSTLPGMVQALEEGLSGEMCLQDRLCWETGLIIARQLLYLHADQAGTEHAGTGTQHKDAPQA